MSGAAGGGEPFSSTLTRRLVAEGDVEGAAEILGRPHRVEGVVVRGAQRGRELGYPTANVETLPHTAIPADGVYAGWLTADGEAMPAAISVGTNPQFDGTERTVEAYAIDRVGLDLYGLHVAVDFLAYVRGQAKFDSIEALLEAIARRREAAAAELIEAYERGVSRLPVRGLRVPACPGDGVAGHRGLVDRSFAAPCSTVASGRPRPVARHLGARRLRQHRQVLRPAARPPPPPAPPRRDASTWQRAWKRQPAGMRDGSGGSPVSTTGAPSRLRQHRQQGLGVRVSGCRQDLLDRARLHDPAQVHHRDPVRDVPRQPQVVGHHQRGQAQFVPQPQQQREDLAAYRGVQRGHRLVGDDQFGLQDQRAGDDDALALAAGQLVRVAQEEALGRPQPGPRQRLGDRLALVARRTRGCAGPRPPRRTPCAAG